MVTTRVGAAVVAPKHPVSPGEQGHGASGDWITEEPPIQRSGTSDSDPSGTPDLAPEEPLIQLLRNL